MPTARVARTRAAPSKLHTLCSLLSLLLLASTSTLASSSTSSRSTNLFKRLRGSQIAPGVSPAGDDYWCRVEGECLPCPPGARNSDVCKIYGNRRPLICVPRHASNSGHSSPASPVSDAFDDAADLDADLDSDADSSEGDENHTDDKEQKKDTSEAKPKPKPKPPVMKPLVEPAGSQAEADDLARQDTETFRNAGAGGSQGDDDEKEVGGGSKAGLSKADQELQDELQAERRRRQRRARVRARGLAESLRRRQGPISTWEACPKVLHSEHHDYFEFILCNAGFAAVAIAVLVFRQRTLALQQFARLAARIMQTQAV
ncbi:hypothetical protein JCM8115_003156 [Rhodotorula mucilaginosa]